MEYILENENTVKQVVRIKKIELTDFRNISKGTISFPNSELEDIEDRNPSILGLYGQNGSGKTSVIMALSILKRILTGQPLDKRFSSCIRYGCESCSLAFVFGIYAFVSEVEDESSTISEQIEAFYRFDIFNGKDVGSDRLEIKNEVFQIRSMQPDGTILIPKQTLIDTSAKSSGKIKTSFGNATKYEMLISSSPEINNRLLQIKEKKSINGKSFLFSRELQNSIIKDSFIEDTDEAYTVFSLQKKYFDLLRLFSNDDSNIESARSKFDMLENNDSVAPQSNKGCDLVFDEDLSLAEFMNNVVALTCTVEDTVSKMDPGYKKTPSHIYEEDSMSDEYFDEVFDEEFMRLVKCYKVLMTKWTCCGLLRTLKNYGESCLHIIDTSMTGQTNMNAFLPLLIWEYQRNGRNYEVYSDCIDLNMDQRTGVSPDKYSVVTRSIESINTVLTELLPGVQLSLEDSGVETDDEGKKIHFFEIYSDRNETIIPLKYESDGVRRIVSLTSLFIAVYNEPSFTMAIDEIDSGIFEYLLGELFQVFAESAQGQFIFTSHNLRPLEVLPAKYLCFTSVNPEHRFIKLSNRGNCNLRDTYFRKIILGSDSEDVYLPTDRYSIHRALFKAGNRGGANE